MTERLVAGLTATLLLAATRAGPAEREGCGGQLTAERGVLSTPGFPRPFRVPISCSWLISSSSPKASVAVHLTQLYVTTGLTFTEYAYYEAGSAFQLEPRTVHQVTEENVASRSLVVTSRPFLLVQFSLDRLEGNHLRALDGLLDVYGFNLTYSILSDAIHLPDFSCSLAKCSMLGNCYVTFDYSSFYCDCFPGFFGSNCSQGPLCNEATNQCKNGATCRHIAAHNTVCDCPPGFKGPYCERTAPLHDCNGETWCLRQCPYDGTRENTCNCDKDGSAVSQDMTHFEFILRFINITSATVESGKSLEMKLQKQMTKYLRSSNLSKLDEAKVLKLSSTGEAKFHFLGQKKDGNKVRELLLALVEKGRLADLSLQQTQFSFKQEPTLLIQRVETDKKEDRAQAGESFTVSCRAVGSSGLRLSWLKDGVPVNTSLAVRNISIWEESRGEERRSFLWVEAADPLDGGEYTCQAVDWGLQQCKTARLSVVHPLQVTVAPITSTVMKGSNLTIRCFTANRPSTQVGKLGYNWTKNKALFPMSPESEFWEDLYPDGSILKLLNIQKGGAFTCSATGGSWSGQATCRLDVVDGPLASSRCPASGPWPPTAPGLQASASCPPGYRGVAVRLCLLLEPSKGRWQVPDYSRCLSRNLIQLKNAFQGLGLGYEGTTVGRTVWEVARTVGGRGGSYPGEAEPLAHLLTSVLGYLRARRDHAVLLNVTQNFITAVNGLLARKASIVNHQTLMELTETTSGWCLWWGLELGGPLGHLLQGGVLINTLRVNPLQRRLHVSIPATRHTFRYPEWLTGSIELEVENRGMENDSVLAVVIYRDLKNFFPKHFSQKVEDGREVEFAVEGPVISVAADEGLAVSTLFQTSSLCGATENGQSWDLGACNLTLRGCHCRGRGLFAPLLSVSQLHKRRQEEWTGSLRVRIGCWVSLGQSLITVGLLLARYYRRPSCLLYLKIQSCLSLSGAVVIFIFAASDSISQTSYTYICLGLQLLLLVAVSSQLAKMVIVYSELLKIPMVRYFKQTVIIILTSLCGVCCLCSLIVEGYTGQEPWWWLRLASPSFFVALSYTAVLLLLELLIGADLFYKLASVLSAKAKPSLSTRAGLVKRSAVLLLLIVSMGSCSVLYANRPTLAAQNAFSLAVGSLGFALFTLYIAMSETKPKNVLFLKRMKDLIADEIYSSTSDNSFFTKVEGEAECEGAPPDVTAASSGGGAGSSGVLQRCGPSEEILLRPSKPLTPRKSVSFHSDLVTGCKVIEERNGRDEADSPEPMTGLVRASYYQGPPTDPAQGHLQEVGLPAVCFELPGPLSKADVLNRISHDLDYLLNKASPGAHPSQDETQTSL